jgi:predicted DNA-binding antitoxin AbrB/MazE fold protein
MPDLTVVYESGILRPTSPIAFPEGQTLQIRILEPETLALRFEQALQTLIATGALTNPTPDPTQPLPEITLIALSPSQLETYGPNPVSDIIISDRGSL